MVVVTAACLRRDPSDWVPLRRMEESAANPGLSRDVRARAAEERFAFGRNWSNFLKVLSEDRIRHAELSLKRAFECDDLAGQRFLDIGSGSGLFSLAARRLGAQVHSFDYDADSVACTEELRARYYPNDPDWRVERGSALDRQYLVSLGPFDVVYSWGVLHHTGAMWRALEYAQIPVAPGGRLLVALYNDMGGKSRRWRTIKRWYTHVPEPLQATYAILVSAPNELKLLARALMRGRPAEYLAFWTERHRRRGMSRWHDIVDWVGGYPYEVARPDEVFNFFRRHGFVLDGLTIGGGLGCSEFVFTRRANLQKPAEPTVEGLGSHGTSPVDRP